MSLALYLTAAIIGGGLYHSLIGKYLPSKDTASLKIVSTQEEIAASTETHSS